METPSVYAVVVTYNGDKWYDRCLGSLANSDLPVHTVVIDNASSPSSVQYLKSAFPDIVLIEEKDNLGFAKANNIGIRYALDNQADFIFLLNQDAWVEKNTLTELVQTFDDNSNVGIASPLHLNGSYSALDKRFASYLTSDFTSDAFMGQLRSYYPIPFINAAAWLVSRNCITTVGGFDTSLFHHYGEDVNYCQRVLYHHYSIILNTRCSICHDRECRNASENEVNTIIASRTPFFWDKIEYGDINHEFDIESIIKRKYLSLAKALLLFSGARIRTINEQIGSFKQIMKSRSINKVGGEIWI